MESIKLFDSIKSIDSDSIDSIEFINSIGSIHSINSNYENDSDSCANHHSQLNIIFTFIGLNCMP